MKSWKVHYLNKYPGGSVESSETSFKVYDGEGKHVISLEKGGDGGWHDKSEEYGLEGRHDLAPIPKDSRVHKVVDGKISKDELAEEREALREEFVRGNKIASCAELKKEGFDFCEKQRVTRRPDKKQAAANEAAVEAAAPAEKKKKKNSKKSA